MGPSLKSSLSEVSEAMVEPIREMRYDKLGLIFLNIGSLLPFILLVSVFFPLTEFLSGSDLTGGVDGLLILSYFILPILIVSMIHELLHGRSIQMLVPEIKVKYGFRFLYKMPVFYTNFDAPLYRDQFIFLALAPLVIGTPLFLILYAIFAVIGTSWGLYLAGLLYFCFVINFLGAMGDMMLVSMLLRFPKTVIFQSELEKFESFTAWKSKHTTESLEELLEGSATRIRLRNAGIFIGLWIAILIVLNFVLDFVMTLVVLNSERDEITFLAWTGYDRGFTEEDGMYEFEIGAEISNIPLMLALVTLLSILVYKLIKRRKKNEE